MRIVGIIAEYNPFHNGHLYQLRQAGQNADFVVVVLSGSFVQRGEPAAYDKWMRCQWALEAGADLVLELPAAYVLQSARGFAQGAVQTLAAAGCNALSFGTESDDPDTLEEAARLLYDESSQFQKNLKSELKKGKSYPRARHAALLSSGSIQPEIASCLEKPNFLLASEYIRAIHALPEKMEILPVLRKGEAHDAALRIMPNRRSDEEDQFASASSIRALTREDPVNPGLFKMLPEFVCDDVNHFPISDMYDLESILLYTLRNSSEERLAKIFGADEGLEHLLKRAGNCASLDDALDTCKSKRYTRARLRRLFCAVMLHISAELIALANELSPPYLRVLGFREEASSLLNRISTGDVPLITRKREMDQLEGDARRLLALDIRATSLQALSFPDADRRIDQRDYTEPVIVWKG